MKSEYSLSQTLLVEPSVDPLVRVDADGFADEEVDAGVPVDQDDDDEDHAEDAKRVRPIRPTLRPLLKF